MIGPIVNVAWGFGGLLWSRHHLAGGGEKYKRIAQAANIRTD